MTHPDHIYCKDTITHPYRTLQGHNGTHITQRKDTMTHPYHTLQGHNNTSISYISCLSHNTFRSHITAFYNTNTNKQPMQEIVPQLQYPSRQTISTPLPSSLESGDIPQAFSEYFPTKIITIRNSFLPTSPTVTTDKTACSGRLLQIFTPFTEQYVLEILQKNIPKYPVPK